MSLQQQLQRAQSQHEHQLAENRRLAQEHQQAHQQWHARQTEWENQRKQWTNERHAWQQQLQDADQQRQQNEALKSELQRLRSELGETQNQLVARTNERNSLKHELENVATTAASEQAKLVEQQKLENQRWTSVLARKDELLCELRGSVLQHSQETVAWAKAHHAAVSLADWLDQQCGELRNEFAELEHEFLRYQHNTAEAASVFEDENQSLEATIAMLRTDHETVEITCCDLSHECERLEMELIQVQAALHASFQQAADQRAESLHALQALNGQLHTNQRRLASEAEEKSSLLRSIAELKQLADEFDASLFAKDQEIAATKKLVEEATRQLQSERREHETSCKQNEAIRTELRALSQQNAALEKQLSDQMEMAEVLETELSDKHQELRELQSAARAAEANSLLRIGEAEQIFAVKREELESTIEQLQMQLDEQTSRQTETNQEVIVELQNRHEQLESDLCKSAQAARATSIENDRLQKMVDTLNQRLDDAHRTVVTKSEQLKTLESRIADSQQAVKSQTESATEIQRQLQSERQRSASYADSVATLQREIAQRDKRIAELTAGDHSSAECKRLSQELARRISTHSQERQALLDRIDQLRQEPAPRRAA